MEKLLAKNVTSLIIQCFPQNGFVLLRTMHFLADHYTYGCMDKYVIQYFRVGYRSIERRLVNQEGKLSVKTKKYGFYHANVGINL